MEKPLILRIEEAKQELIQRVNDIIRDYELNCYLLEPVFADIYTQVRATARNELSQARAMNGTVETVPTIRND